MPKLGNLASRFAVALIAVPALSFIFYSENPVYTWLFISAASLIASHEFFSMTLSDRGDRNASLLLSFVAASALFWLDPAALAASTDNRALMASSGPLAIFLGTVPIAIYYLFRFGDVKTVAARAAASITGIFYVGLLFSFVPLVKRDFGPDGGDVMVFLLLIAWMGDTGAYFAGRFLGKRKLYPAVSPNKTWAGAIGGLLMSLLSCAVMKLVVIELRDPPSLMHALTWFDVCALAIPGAMLGQIGDLFESLIKRSTGVKDSGSLLPGHGGILDRIDAVLFITPYVYLYLTLRGFGG
ncbi:phosphatidate cytidylyltransferase [Haliangium ochraceum]|uniref:Phosphatidate cytidylyltransferase n=1 Tax=Haliangium ochraceum (strain DSM 14365 / JCM 11303 / SMP-2) TaxID=502025 RepID=D0LK91_HALO1|nr:phosphatidate cytidylyltransferase [Haliangium ochraceum]ACY13125.1 phosphatidate cytidylyltransferase [Haliangium ochraceum DSM 14365]